MVETVSARVGFLDLGWPDEEREQWTAIGLSDLEAQRVRSLVSQGILAQAIASGETVVTSSAQLDPRFRDRPSIRVSGAESVICGSVFRESNNHANVLVGDIPLQQGTLLAGKLGHELGFQPVLLQLFRRESQELLPAVGREFENRLCRHNLGDRACFDPVDTGDNDVSFSSLAFWRSAIASCSMPLRYRVTPRFIQALA